MSYYGLSWSLGIGDEFKREFFALDEDVRTEILALARLLQQFGPQLGRPRVDTLNGSRHANMKEIVAGDPMQLPPTSFFQATLSPDEDEEDDDDAKTGEVPLESLLDDSVAIVPVFQESHLRWHYRSRDERLIK